MNSYTVFLLDYDKVFLSQVEADLTKYLSSLSSSFEVHSFSSRNDFLQAIAENQPDLIISDVDFPGEKQNGILFFHFLKEHGCLPEIIFLTEYINFATDIFELHPLYFILKSEYKQRIPFAIDSFLAKMRQRQNKLTLTLGNVTEVILTDSILYCERVQRKTVIHCMTRSISVTALLSDIAQSLPSNSFAFSHQSILVNLQHIVRFGKTELSLINGSKLPISRSHFEEFHTALSAYLSK